MGDFARRRVTFSFKLRTSFGVHITHVKPIGSKSCRALV